MDDKRRFWLENRDYNSENIVISLDVPENDVNNLDLIDIQINLDRLVKSINRTINWEYDLGFDAISLDVIAYEKGSFKIPVRIKKFLPDNPKDFIYNCIIGPLIIYVLTGGTPCVNLPKSNESDEPVRIEQRDLLRNPDTREAVSNIANTVINSDRINGLTVTYIDEGKEKEIKISEKQLKDTAQLTNDEYYYRPHRHHRFARPFTIVRVEKNLPTLVEYDGNLIKIDEIFDHDFEKRVTSREVQLCAGDIIYADIKSDIRRDNQVSYSIRHVFSVSKCVEIYYD